MADLNGYTLISLNYQNIKPNEYFMGYSVDKFFDLIYIYNE